MRPYLTVIYDSFHEALASRVLYFLLLTLTLVLLALAPFSYEVKRMVGFNRMSIYDVPDLVVKFKEQSTAAGENPGKRVLEFGGAELTEIVNRDEDAPFGGREMDTVVEGLNEVLKRKDFYQESAWQDVKLGPETKVILEKGPENLKGDDLTYFNRLLLRDAYPIHLGHVPNEELYLTYWLYWEPIGPLPLTGEMFPTVVKYFLTAFIDLFVGMFAIFVAILVTAPIIPRTFEPGAIDLLLSKPISRSLLIVSKYIGGCAFVFVSVSYFLVGLWLIVGIRLNVWSEALLFCIPVFLFQFAIYYCVSVLAGVIWRNAIVSIVVTILFFFACFGIGTVKTTWFDPFIINPTRLVRMVDTDEGLLCVTQGGEFVQWNDGKSEWDPVLQQQRRWQDTLAMQSVLVGPVYNKPTKSLLFLQQASSGGPPRRRTQRGGKFMIAKWSGNWAAEDGPTAPTGAAWILQDDKDQVLIVASAGVFSYEGDGKAKKTKLFGFDIPLTGKNDFKRLGPDKGVPYFPPFSAAIDPASQRLLIANQGTIYLLNHDEDKYVITNQRKRKTEDPVVLGLTGDRAIVADEEGNVEICDAKSLEVEKTFRPAGDTPAAAIEASPDGKYFAVLFHGGALWLYDNQAGQGTRVDSDASAVAFRQKELLFADNTNRVRSRDLATGATKTLYWPVSNSYRLTYDWVVQPIYYIFPKPGELNNLLKYLVTEESTSSLQGPRSTGDLRELREADNIVMPVVHNFIFICVMLGITCFYVSRLDL